MKYLLDTNVFLWSCGNTQKLTQEVKEILTSDRSEVYLSAATSWEISIKCALGSLRLPKPPSELIPYALQAWPIRALNITHDHALRAGELPPHHRDPFDRLLIAQAQAEKLTLLTGDHVFEKYKVDMICCAR